MATPSFCSICSNHMIAFLLYLLLQVYLHAGISPIVSGFKNLRRNGLLHASRLSGIREKPRYFRFAKSDGERYDRLVLETWRHLDSIIQGRVYSGMAETCVSRTTREIPPAPPPHLVHPIIRYGRHRSYVIEIFLSIKVVGVPWFRCLQSESLGQLRNAHGRKDTLSKNTKCSIFILMILRPFEMSSVFHLSPIALIRMKCKSNALALWAIATIFLAEGRGSNR